MERVLVAGASGQLGRHVVDELRRRGVRVRALSRNPARLPAPANEAVRGDLLDPASLAAACEGVDAVFSCAGASMDLNDITDRRGPLQVDWEGNHNLLRAAQTAGVRRFGYVPVFGGREMRHLEYTDAHERIVDALAASGLETTIIRPTGFFSFFGEIVKMARRGRGIVIGDGAARTNPVHDADVARAPADALLDGTREVSIGGPETFSRDEIVRLAFRAIGREPRVTHVPPSVFRGMAAVTRPFNRRLAALLAFGAEVSQVDCVAPAHAGRRLEDFFRTYAG